MGTKNLATVTDAACFVTFMTLAKVKVKLSLSTMEASMGHRNVLLSTRCRRLAKFFTQAVLLPGAEHPSNQWAQTRSRRLENRTPNLPDRSLNTVLVRSSSFILVLT
jgi:hypothetical protein